MSRVYSYIVCHVYIVILYVTFIWLYCLSRVYSYIVCFVWRCIYVQVFTNPISVLFCSVLLVCLINYTCVILFVCFCSSIELKESFGNLVGLVGLVALRRVGTPMFKTNSTLAHIHRSQHEWVCLFFNFN